MKATPSTEREIVVVKHLIWQLHQCLKIYTDADMQVEFQNTMKDIEKCERELKRLNGEINDAKDGAKLS